MKKKLPVVTVAARDEAARLAELPAEATVALQDLSAAIKDGFMAFCCAAGLAVVEEIMAAEMTDKAGPKGRHDPDRTATRNGSAPGSVVLGGRTVPLRRPRATKAGGGEVHLDSYDAFNDRDLLSQLAVERMLAGVATRRHALVAEPIGEELEEVAKGDSRSAVSRRFVAATTEKLAELLASDLSVHDAAVLMIDGIMFHECCCVVALLITTDGTKIPVGVWEGDTENTTVVKHLLADLVERGLRYEAGLLLVIDGGKALAAGIKRVFGRHAVVQRCTLHKRRDVADYLDPELARRIDRQLKGAFNDADAARGLQGGARSRCSARARAPERRRFFTRRARRHVQRAPARGLGPPGPIAFVHQCHRVDDLDRAPGLLGRQALAATRPWCGAGSAPA